MITIENNQDDFELTAEMKAILDERLNENKDDYFTAEESIDQLKKKYGL
jgi:hypothetical protein